MSSPAPSMFISPPLTQGIQPHAQLLFIAEAPGQIGLDAELTVLEVGQGDAV